MLNIADFILIGIIAVFVIVGSVRGFVKSLFGLGSIVLSLVLALTLYPVVSDVIEKSPVGDFIYESVENIFGQDKNKPIVEEEQQLLPDIIKEPINAATENAKQAVSKSVADAAINIVGMLAVFLLVKILIWILAKVLDIMTRLPIIHGCNKFLGAVFGGVSGVLIAYLLLGALTFTTILNTTSELGLTVQNSLLVSQMYENNILLYFLQDK